jgi:polysaccharide deacetylase family sporulation protein PdaB
VWTLAAAVALFGSFEYVSSYVSVSNNVNGRELPIYSVETEEQKVALTFDAAWGNEDTDRILDILKAHQVHATFFMTGDWVENYPEDVKRIYAEGHDLGNHSENHKNMTQLSEEEQKAEIQAVHERVKQLTGADMQLFRAPYGAYDDGVIRAAEACGYYSIQWSVDSLDWKDYGVDNILQTVLEHAELQNGAIILCHNGAAFTADALDALLTGLEEKGYQIVPVSELIYKDTYHMDVTGRQISDEDGNK